MDAYVTRERVVAAALNLAAARYYVEARPEDPHGPDHVDYETDRLDQAAREHVQRLAQGL